MANVLIRGLGEAAVERIDAEASGLGLSSNEFLRRKFEAETVAKSRHVLTAADWNRSAAVFGDLSDDDVMGAAWR